MLIKNKKIELLYNIELKYEAGIVLTGDEVKSIRKHSPSITESYCCFYNNELFLRNLLLTEAKSQNRLKKLLLHKKQINRLFGLYSQKRYLIVPMEFYETKDGFFKLLIGIGTKLKLIDKREKLKERDLKSFNEF